MANPEHLEILERGVEAWNRWRREHPEIIPDLRLAPLKGASLAGGINFSQANLRMANFNGASLSGADFRKANLYYTNFNNADLRGTHFEHTDLRAAQLEEAVLREAYLVKAKLYQTQLSKADLAKANLSQANLTEAKLFHTNLVAAKLIDANLKNTCLHQANLSRANLSRANLFQANLSESQSLSAIFEEAILTDANITNWVIDEKTNFTNVECDYIYIFDDDDYHRTPFGYYGVRKQQRYPKNGAFEPGDFEKFVSSSYTVPVQNSERKATENQRQRQQNIKTQKIIDLNFNKGIDGQAFLNSYKELGVEVGEDSIPIQDIKYERDGTVIICIQSPPGYDQEEVKRFIQEQYQQQFQHIDKISNQERRDKEREIAEYKRQNIDLLEIIKKQVQQKINVNQEQNLNINNYDYSTNDVQNIRGDGNQVAKGNGNNFIDGNDNTNGSPVPSSSELQQNSISEILFSIIKSPLVGWVLYTFLVLSVMAFITWLPTAISNQSTPKQAETEVQGRNNP